MDTWVFPTFWLLGTMLQWTLVYKYLLEFLLWLILCIYPEVELLDQTFTFFRTVPVYLWTGYRPSVNLIWKQHLPCFGSNTGHIINAHKCLLSLSSAFEVLKLNDLYSYSQLPKPMIPPSNYFPVGEARSSQNIYIWGTPSSWSPQKSSPAKKAQFS